MLIIFSTSMFSAKVLASGKSDKEPWKVIFNGKDFTGWDIIGSFGKYWVEDSTIMCHKMSNTPEHTFLRTKKVYSDFILECDNKIDGDFNSGILFRCEDAPDTASAKLYGYQVKIDPSSRKWSGGVFTDFGKTWHWLYTLEDDARAREAYKINEWNHIRVEAIGSSIKVWVNGIPTCNLINYQYTRGNIAFKIHSMGNEPEKEKVKGYFKNVRILEDHPEKYQKIMDIPPLEME